MDQIPEQALDWFRAGKGAALATVVETWGSAPRRVGAMLAVSGEGELVGSVSGGCVENAVIEEADEIIRTGVPKVLSYGVTDETAWTLGLPCGGTIDLLVIRLNDSGMVQTILEHTPVALFVRTSTGELAVGNASQDTSIRARSRRWRTRRSAKGGINKTLRPRRPARPVRPLRCV